MGKEKTIEVKRVVETRMVGLHDAAKRLRCTPEHLRMVIKGTRTSARLLRRAEQMGVRLPSMEVAQ